MKLIDSSIIFEKVTEKLSEIGYIPDNEIKEILHKSLKNEESETAKDILNQLITNIDIAKEKDYPLCQDTGLVVFWVEIGTEIYIKGNDIKTILNDSVRHAFKINNYRHSVVSDPVHRINTKDNTPSVIHLNIVNGDYLKISMMLKGGGSENMSSLKMLKPAEGIDGIRSFVLNTVKNAGANACPPLFVGIGIGGNFETCAVLAKKALFRNSSTIHPNPFWQKEEKFLLDEINKLNIGPMGLGGKTTALKVNIETLPCHIASLPVAVNLECHSHRMSEIIL